MLELNQPIKNPVLEKMMDVFKKQPSPRTELDMINAILTAKFLFPVNFSEPPVDGKVNPNASVQYYLITNTKEEQFYMAFTNRTELEKWSKGEHRDAFTAPIQVFGALLEKSKESIKGVVINPMSQSITLTKEMIANFPKRREALLKMVPPRYMLGKLKEEPEELEEALCKYFKKKQKSIQEAWLFLGLREGERKPKLMLIVDYEGEAEDAKEMFPEIGEYAKEYLKPEEGLEIVRRNEKFAEDLLEKNEPFYRKKAGLFW